MIQRFWRGSQVVRQGSAKAPFRRFDSDPRLDFFLFWRKKTASFSKRPGLFLDEVTRQGDRG
jgi:hypothetical protein